jgi:hypothetical protein
VGTNNWFPRNNQYVQPFASINRIATPTSVALVNFGGYNACQIFVDLTVDVGTDTVVFNFDTFNPATGTWVEILESAAVGDVGGTVYQIGGVGTAVANVSTALHPGRKIRVRPVHTGTNGLSYSVTVSWLNA